MKKITFIIIFLCYVHSYGQNIEHVQKLDTVFVKFKKSVYQTKEGSQNYHFYTIRLGRTTDKGSLYFTKPDFKENSTETAKKYLPRIENKSFLRKHKRDIVGIDFFKKYGIEKSTYEVFAANSVIYIIDCDKQKNGKIILYRVQMSSSFHMGE